MTSFHSVLRLTEVNRLILSGAMRLSSQYLAYRLLSQRMEFLGTPILSKDWRYSFYGGLLGIILIGPTYDFLLSDSAYMILDIYTVITFLWQIVLLIMPKIHDKHCQIMLFIYGFSQATVMFLLVLLIPLMIASKVRSTRYEVTGAGTCIAVVNIGFLVLVQGIFFLTNFSSFLTQNIEQYWEMDRAIVALLMLLSLIPTFPLVKAEYRKFDWRRQLCGCSK